MGAPAPVIQVLRLSSALFGATVALPALADPLDGSIQTKVRLQSERFFGERSESLIHGAPLPARSSSVATERTPGQLSAKDLIAELQTINSQIHRMMFQVERAVANLATVG